MTTLRYVTNETEQELLLSISVFAVLENFIPIYTKNIGHVINQN